MTVARRPDRRDLAPMSDAEYQALLSAQGGGCAICGAQPRTRRLHRDHDHKTRELRGLLCHACNRRLWRGVSPGWLRRAESYLLNPPAQRVSGDS